VAKNTTHLRFPYLYIRTFCRNSCQDQFCYNARDACEGLGVKCTRSASTTKDYFFLSVKPTEVADYLWS
jgi:hypothetical protein